MAAPRQTAAAASFTLSAPPSRQAGRQAPNQGGTGGPEAPGPPALPVAATGQPLRAIHVRGKSGLKHTKQLLDCWLQHPDWPILTVVGPLPNEQISSSEAKRYMAAANVRVPRPGKPNGEGLPGSPLGWAGLGPPWAGSPPGWVPPGLGGPLQHHCGPFSAQHLCCSSTAAFCTQGCRRAAE
jgi:hypothetical protein